MFCNNVKIFTVTVKCSMHVFSRIYFRVLWDRVCIWRAVFKSVTCKKLTTMRNRLYDPIPPVKTSFSSLCSKNCFKTSTRYGNTGNCWNTHKSENKSRLSKVKTATTRLKITSHLNDAYQIQKSIFKMKSIFQEYILTQTHVQQQDGLLLITYHQSVWRKSMQTFYGDYQEHDK